ncbi:MAG: undecaprenyl-diphosphate phosphatase [Candidatus Baldrarchaeia archaeon]
MSWGTYANSLFAMILGLIQGCLEWIPVSSEAFLMIYLISVVKLVPSTALAISLLLHFSTMLTVLLFFKKEFKEALKTLINTFNRDKENNIRGKSVFRLLWTSLLGSAISGGAIFILYINLLATVEKSFLELAGLVTLALIGITMIVTGLIMRKSFKGFKSLEDLNYMDGLLGGLIQGLAVIPGISRSGVTLTFFLYRKLKKEDAVVCSFLIYVPAVILSTSYYLLSGDIINIIRDVNVIFLSIAFISSFIISLLTIKSFVYMAEKLSFSKFLIFFGLLIFLFNFSLIVSMI